MQRGQDELICSIKINKFHTGLLNPCLHGGCNPSSRSGVCIVCAGGYAYVCMFIYVLPRRTAAAESAV